MVRPLGTMVLPSGFKWNEYRLWACVDTMVMPLGVMVYALCCRTRWCNRQSVNGTSISKLATMVMPLGTVMPLALNGMNSSNGL